MPVKWLMHWQPNQGTTLTSQVMKEACDVAESFPGVSRDGRWRSAMTFYRAVPREQSNPPPTDLPRDLLGISLHDLPNEYLFVMRSQRLIMRAHSSVQTVMDKLQSYKGRFFINFEGLQYKWGDFRLRIGKCINIPNESLRGIVMEVEYLPLSSIDKSHRVMEEFYEIWQEAVASKSLAGHFINAEGNFAEYGLGDSYTPQHTAVLYGTCVFQVTQVEEQRAGRLLLTETSKAKASFGTVAQVEEQRAGRLLLTETSKAKASFGTIIVVGPDALNIRPGNTVLYSKYAGHEFKSDDGSYYVVLRISGVMGILSYGT